jgi:hypothetical protein
MFSWFLALTTAAAAEPTRDEQATHIVTVLFDAMHFDTMMQDKLQGFAGPGLTGLPEDWRPLMKQAAVDELAHDKPVMYAIFGRQLAAKLTDGQLAAGTALVADARVVAFFAAAASGQPAPALSKADQRDLERLTKSPDARSFAEALKGSGADLEGAKDELVREFVPGFFRRFGELAEAAEAARRPPSP